MSHFDYISSQGIAVDNHPFYALIMAAMRQADDINFEKLKCCWPEIHKELTARYHAPGGYLDGELAKPKK